MDDCNIDDSVQDYLSTIKNEKLLFSPVSEKIAKSAQRTSHRDERFIRLFLAKQIREEDGDNLKNVAKLICTFSEEAKLRILKAFEDKPIEEMKSENYLSFGDNILSIIASESLKDPEIHEALIKMAKAKYPELCPKDGLTDDEITEWIADCMANAIMSAKKHKLDDAAKSLPLVSIFFPGNSLLEELSISGIDCFAEKSDDMAFRIFPIKDEREEKILNKFFSKQASIISGFILGKTITTIDYDAINEAKKKISKTILKHALLTEDESADISELPINTLFSSQVFPLYAIDKLMDEGELDWIFDAAMRNTVLCYVVYYALNDDICESLVDEDGEYDYSRFNRSGLSIDPEDKALVALLASTFMANILTLMINVYSEALENKKHYTRFKSLILTGEEYGCMDEDSLVNQKHSQLVEEKGKLLSEISDYKRLIRDLTTENNSLKQKLNESDGLTEDEAQKELKEKNRIINEMNAQINKINKSNETQIQELTDQLEDAKAILRAYEASDDEEDSEDSDEDDDIDIKEKIEEIKDKRILVAGGRQNIINLVKESLPDFNYVSAANDALPSVHSIEKIALIYRHMPHSLTYKMQSIARKNNIQLEYIEGKSATAIIKDMCKKL